MSSTHHNKKSRSLYARIVGCPIVTWYYLFHRRRRSDETQSLIEEDDTEKNLNDMVNNNTHKYDPYDDSLRLFRLYFLPSLLCILVLPALGIFVLSYLLLGQNDPFEFQVDSLDVSSMTIDNRTRTQGYMMEADFNLTLSFITVKDSTLFEDLFVSIEHEGEFLSSTTLEPCYLKGEGRKRLRVELTVRDVVADSITRDLVKQQELQFTVKAWSHYRILSDHISYSHSLAIKKLRLIGEGILFTLMIGTFVEGLLSMTGLSPFDDSKEQFYGMVFSVLVFTAASGGCVFYIVKRKIGSDDNVSPTAPSPGPEQQATDLTSPTQQASQLETSPTSPKDQV